MIELKLKKNVNEALKEFHPFKIKYRIKTKSNKIKWVWEQGRGIYDINGKLMFLEGFITDINDQVIKENENQQLIDKLQKALKEIKTLKGIIPICASCKKIRDDKGYWNQIEKYIKENTDADFSHSFCPDCVRKLYPDYKE